MTPGDIVTHFLCLSVDVQGYGQQDSVRQRQIQEVLVGLLDEAGQRADVKRDQWLRQAKGDEELALVPYSLPLQRVIGEFCVALATGLRQHNQSRGPDGRLRLRLAMDAGPVSPAVNGYAGQAVVGASRLVGSEPVRRALALAERADLAVILADGVHRDWVRSGHCAVEPGWFRRVYVSVKEFQEDAWLWVPNVDGPRTNDPDSGWEHRQLADAIRRNVDGLKTKRLDHELRFAANAGALAGDAAVAAFVIDRLDALAGIIGMLASLFTPDQMAWAMGRPGEPGDPDRIDHLAGRVGLSYEQLLDWAARIRGTTVAAGHRRLLDHLTALADQPLGAVRGLVDGLADAGDALANHYGWGGEGHVAIEVNLTIALDPARLALCRAELDRLLRGHRPG